MILTPKHTLFCKENLCLFNSCLQFKFKECLEENALFYSDIPCDDFGDFNDDDDDEAARTEQILNFVDVLSFVSLFIGSPNEPIFS